MTRRNETGSTLRGKAHGNPVMAMDTAEPATRKRYSPDPTRNAWQVPLFLVGASVFVSAWQGWLPLGTPDPTADFARDLTALPELLRAGVACDKEELKGLLARVAGGVDVFPEHAAMGRFILGSGCARLAELTPDLDDARGHWTLAKQHFESTHPTGTARFRRPAATGVPLRQGPCRGGTAGEHHRRGSAAADGNPRQRPLQRGTRRGGPLAGGPGDADHPARPGQREALTRYLTTTGMATPAASLARAKYLLGDVHFRRKEPDLAASGWNRSARTRSTWWRRGVSSWPACASPRTRTGWARSATWRWCGPALPRGRRSRRWRRITWAIAG